MDGNNDVGHGSLTLARLLGSRVSSRAPFELSYLLELPTSSRRSFLALIVLTHLRALRRASTILIPFRFLFISQGWQQLSELGWKISTLGRDSRLEGKTKADPPLSSLLLPSPSFSSQPVSTSSFTVRKKPFKQPSLLNSLD